VAQPLFGPIALPLDELARQSDQRPRAPQGAQAFHQQISGLSREMERARRFERPTPTLANFPVAFSMLFDSTPKCPQISDILIIF
jgi:hypothetical protein